MSTTSVKHREFVSEPMGEKEVIQVAGIGQKYGEILTEKGFDKAYVLFGQFLLLKKDEDLFVSWLKDEVSNMQERYARACYNCFKEWAEQFI